MDERQDGVLGEAVFKLGEEGGDWGVSARKYSQFKVQLL